MENRLDEFSIFGNDVNYKTYKKAVIKKLMKHGFELASITHSIENYIRDFFIDRMPVDDCVASCRDQILRSREISESINYLNSLGYLVD